MSFPRYPAYKPSSVEWLGEVPEHWEFKKLKHCILRLGSGGTPESSNPEFWADDYSDGSIPWVAIGDMSTVSRVTSTAKSLTPFGLSSKNLEVFPSGSLLYSIYASLGKVAILGIDAAFNQAILAILPNEQCASQAFLRYWLENLEKHLEYYASSNTQANLNAAKVLNYPVSVPSLPEQRTIATFLDRETAKIDALIAEQQRLIELLQEKRQAVISHAVTKGLNPNAPMKDSGVEWLGEVPEHWETLKLSKITDKITNGYVGPTRDILVEAGVPYIQATHIKRGRINFDKGYFVRSEWSAAHSKSVLAEGDVLVVQTGAGTGDVGLVSSEDAGFNCHALIILAPTKSVISGHFLSAVLLSDCGQQKLESIQAGGMHPHLNCGNIKFVDIPVPPIDEQEAIINFIAMRTESFDSLSSDAMVAIDLLQERCSALISAAVTGQIDVRGLVPEASAA
jgi:type I restriction enzyme S subunit